MKKIAIITWYYRCYNYGGLLQAYALQKALEKMGYITEQISYPVQKREVKDLLRIFRNYGLPWFVNGVISTLKLGKLHREQKNFFEKRNNLFDKFGEDIPHSKIVDKNTISSIVNDYDAFICGSDQIWNPLVPDENYYLAFVPDNKIKFSYAASIGQSRLHANEIAYMKQYCERFTAVSVRERNAADILNQHLSKKVETVLDPTLLLDRQDWESITGARLIDKKYIFVYFLGKAEPYKASITEFAMERNCEVVYIPYMSAEKEKDYTPEWYDFREAGPIEFLNLIRNAEYIITDSFHGTVFSILFEKEFITFKRCKDKDKNSMNSRVEMLLDVLGLEKRLFEYGIRRIEVKTIQTNYSLVKEKLEKLRCHSMDFLKTNIEKN